MSKIHDTLQQIPQIHESLQHMQNDLNALAEQVMTLKKHEVQSESQADDIVEVSRTFI